MEQKNTRLTRGAVHSRSQTGHHRRAYLDTYAKQRGGSSASQQPVAAPVATPVVPTAQPVAITSTPSAAVATIQAPALSLTVDDYIQPQPAALGAVYTPEPPVAAAPIQPAEVAQTLEERMSYLDTLSQRHASVAASNAVQEDIEVVHQPVQPLESEAWFEDPSNDERIEANLKALYSSSLTDMIATSETSASASHVRTIVASALACGVLSVGIFSFFAQYSAPPVVAQPIAAPVIEVESSNRQQPAGTDIAAAPSSGPRAVDPSHPVRLVVSSIGVNAPIEGVGVTQDGLMAVPQAYGVVGWYNKGALPGQAGPAVLVGHYTGNQGGVFDKLKNVKEGDLITTTNGRGQSFTYRVTVLREFERDKVPMAELFKSSDDSRLEIITCSGQWIANNYTNRTVVTAELVR